MIHFRILLGQSICIGLLALTSLFSMSLAEDPSELEELAFKSAVARVAPAVVRIETFATAGAEGDGPSTNVTSGLLVSEDGYIISSQFALASDTGSIIVTRSDGQRSSAKIVAQDHGRSLALLKATFADASAIPQVLPSTDVRVGQWAIAVGRGFDPAKVNSSVGIVSARERVWGKALQTDAKVSPNNYGGPLIDIAGRVIGILAPLSPHSPEIMAGAEWYDGGIGFAVPLSDVMPHLDKLKSGQDLKPGLMGISYSAENLFGQQVEISAVSPKSPAYKAGVRKGDLIVRVDDRKVDFAAQLRHVLGPKYAGERIALTVARAGEEQKFEFNLADTIEPYERPRLGVLPSRNSTKMGDGNVQGVEVRHVIQGSGAALAGLTAGDRIIKVEGLPANTSESVRQAVATMEPGQTVSVEYVRGAETKTVPVKLDRRTADLVERVSAEKTEVPMDAEQIATGVIDIKLPDEATACFAYIPESYRRSMAAGLIVWLHAPDEYQKDKLVQTWKPLCDASNLILLAPAAMDQSHWRPNDAGFVRRVAEQVLNNYSIDRSRVVVHGYQAGGTMAYFLATTQRELYTGLIPVDAELPSRLRCPENDPIYPLSVLSYWFEKSRVAKQAERTHKRFQVAKYPIADRKLEGDSRYLNTKELEVLVNWIDGLDQI